VEDDVHVWRYAIVSCMPETMTTTVRLSGMGDADVQSDYTLHQTHRRHRTLVHQTVREGLQVTGGIAILYIVAQRHVQIMIKTNVKLNKLHITVKKLKFKN